jgi:hypothetical protein
MNEKFIVIKHEPSGKFVAFSDETGPFGVELLEMATILPESIANEFIGYEDGYYDDWIEGIGKLNTKDFSIYEVEVVIKSKLN